MRLSFPVPSTRVPVGGIAVIYEFAMHMADRGHDVHILHHELFGGDAVATLDEVDWFEFRDGPNHVFVPDRASSGELVPEADVFFGHAPEVEMDPRMGLPVQLVQGWKMYPKEDEMASFHAPCPKVCVARWLVDIGRSIGVPAGELVHVPLGLHHTEFCITRPVDQRSPEVSFCYNHHPRKGADLAIEVIEAVRAARPDVTFSAFGTSRPERALPDWLRFVVAPTRDQLRDDIYNACTIFLCTSVVEGFGLTSLEAMACGAGLVTTDNGGSQDYAEHEVTAFVSPAEEPEPLIRNVVQLIDDDLRRRELATAGAALAKSFTWARSAEKLEAFLEAYLADPQAFGRP